MRIALDLSKTIEENASGYFEKAKRARKKHEGAVEAMEATKERLAARKAEEAEAREHASLQKPPERWYHKYRWSFTRNGHLLVGGQNAGANETLVKHHAAEGDWVFHTDMAGSPFFILKPEGDVTDGDLEDAATLTACYSKAWARGMEGVAVARVRPEQVSKQAPSGESLSHGAFMLLGKTYTHNPPLVLGVGVIEQEGVLPEVFVGSVEACKERCAKHAVLVPGDRKTSDVAKELRRRMGGELDAYVKAMPAGGSRIRQ